MKLTILLSHSRGGTRSMSSRGPTDMEANQRMKTSGVTENPSQSAGSAPVVTPQVGVTPLVGLPAGAPLATANKKRGRPRKIGSDEPETVPKVRKAPSSESISSVVLALPVIGSSSNKREKSRMAGSVSKNQRQISEMESLGNCAPGSNFTPHTINVRVGEDVAAKVLSFSQLVPRAICILAATGMIQSVTLRQPDSSGNTTYEGCFELLSLSGLRMPSVTEGINNTSGELSVLLANPEGLYVSGSVASLVAAGPVQVVVGSFLTRTP